MSNPLAVLQGMQPPTVSAEEFDANISAFYPRVAIGQALSDAVKSKLAEAGDFILTKPGKNVVNMGKSITVTPIDIMWCAIDTKPELKFNYDKDSDEFKEIQMKSEKPKSGAMWGPIYLLWVKDYGFVTMLFGSKTLRNDSAYIRANMWQTVNLTGRLIKESWYGLIISQGEPDETIPQNIAEIEAARARFINETKTKTKEETRG